MFLQSAWQSARPAVAATFVLLAAALFAPSRAEASCGDYVMGAGRMGGGHPMDQHSADSRQDPQSPSVPRCHGPLCSDNSLPPIAPVPKIEIAVERWAVPGSARLNVLPSPGVLLTESHDLPCDGHGLSILRPPR